MRLADKDLKTANRNTFKDLKGNKCNEEKNEGFKKKILEMK